jgi:hypothetical protein
VKSAFGQGAENHQLSPCFQRDLFGTADGLDGGFASLGQTAGAQLVEGRVAGARLVGLGHDPVFSGGSGPSFI